jgi:hypothetical protein
VWVRKLGKMPLSETSMVAYMASGEIKKGEAKHGMREPALLIARHGRGGWRKGRRGGGGGRRTHVRALFGRVCF